MFDVRPVDRHFAAIDAIADFPGITIPKKHGEIRERWAAALTEPDPVAALTAAIITGRGDLQRAVLDAWGAAEASSATRATVINETGGPVYMALLDAYQPQAASNYAKIASLFNQHADALHTACAQTDTDAPAEQLVAADDATRAAWLTAQLSAETLTSLLPPLIAVATLAGAHIHGPSVELPLVADLAGCHRRRVWESLNAAGRTSRWGALVACGAKLRAHPEPAAIMAYDPAPPMETRQVRSADNIGIRQETYDPCDQELASAVSA